MSSKFPMGVLTTNNVPSINLVLHFSEGVCSDGTGCSGDCLELEN
jgi:hypothetical protein